MRHTLLLVTVIGAVIQGDRLVADIRRRLMADNYDYMADSSDSTELLQRGASVPIARRDYADNEYIDPAAGHYVPEEAAAEAKDKRDIDVKDKDLLYYVDDQRLDGPSILADVEENVSKQPEESKQRRYKYLEVTVPSGRRSNSGPRRFLQEESPDGVAIVKLGDGPFPEFRLPRDRRQYMGDGPEQLLVPDPPIDPPNALLEPGPDPAATPRPEPPANAFRLPPIREKSQNDIFSDDPDLEDLFYLTNDKIS